MQNGKVVILYSPIVHFLLSGFFDIFKNGVFFDCGIVIYIKNYLTKCNNKKKSVFEAPFYLIYSIPVKLNIISDIHKKLLMY